MRRTSTTHGCRLGVFLLVLAACLPARSRPVTKLEPAPPLAHGVDLHVHVTMNQAIPFFSGEPG
ncbi:MAG TPA: hypothetical protein VK447_13165, partial [Myxococcaceae bacterium]|nr:hypothetical protein [Myxococcaceae bacterium]